jgi:hypothetical protein
MTALEALESVQFVTVSGKRLAVLDADSWEALIEWLEDVEDSEIGRSAIDQLETADHSYQQAGWMKWDEVETALD